MTDARRLPSDGNYPPATREEALRRLRDVLEPEGCRLTNREAGLVVDALWDLGSKCGRCGLIVVPR